MKHNQNYNTSTLRPHVEQLSSKKKLSVDSITQPLYNTELRFYRTVIQIGNEDEDPENISK